MRAVIGSINRIRDRDGFGERGFSLSLAQARSERGDQLDQLHFIGFDRFQRIGRAAISECLPQDFVPVGFFEF